MNRETRRHPPAEPTTLQPAVPAFAAVFSAVYPSGARRRQPFLTLLAAQHASERALAAGAVVSVDLVELRPVSGATQREAAMTALTVVAS